MNHYAHYVRREVATPEYSNPYDPYFAIAQPEAQGFFRPTFHAIPGGHGLATQIRKGDWIWLFSELSTPWGSVPPSLDALIVVATRPQRRRSPAPTLYLKAAPGSEWFPLFDANDLLHNSPLLEGPEGPVKALSGCHKHVGQSLRLVRRIASPAAILAHARRVNEARHTFVSYRLLDGTQAAHKMVCNLMAQGHAVFWDRWSLPRRLAERREILSDLALTRYIRHSIRRADEVRGICTPLYAEDGSYSRTEWDLATRLGKFLAHVPDDA